MSRVRSEPYRLMEREKMDRYRAVWQPVACREVAFGAKRGSELYDEACERRHRGMPFRFLGGPAPYEQHILVRLAEGEDVMLIIAPRAHFLNELTMLGARGLLSVRDGRIEVTNRGYDEAANIVNREGFDLEALGRGEGHGEREGGGALGRNGCGTSRPCPGAPAPARSPAGRPQSGSRPTSTRRSTC